MYMTFVFLAVKQDLGGLLPKCFAVMSFATEAKVATTLAFLPPS